MNVLLKVFFILYNKYLLDKIKLWTISYQYFLYKPSEKDDNCEYLHLVYLPGKESPTFYYHDFASNINRNYTFAVHYLKRNTLHTLIQRFTLQVMMPFK